MSSNEERRKDGKARPLLSFADAPPPADDKPQPDSAPTRISRLKPAAGAQRFTFPSSAEKTKDHDDDRLSADELAALQKRLDAIEAGSAHEEFPWEHPGETPVETPRPGIWREAGKTPSAERSAQVPAPAARSDDTWRPLIDPAAAIAVVKDSRKLLLAATVIGGVVATLYALTIPTMYAASTDILVDPRTIKTVGTELTPGQLPTDASLAIAESQARLVQSSSVLLKVIDDTHLTQDPEFNGTLVPTGIAGYFDSLRSMFTKKTPSDEETLETRVLDNLQKSLTINRDPKTFIYSISVKTREAAKSAKLANTICTEFKKALVSLQSDAARRTSDELADRLSTMRANVEKAEKAASDYRATHDLVDVDGKLISNNDLSRVNDQLTNQRAETARLQARVQVLNGATPDSVIGGTLPEDQRSNTLTTLRGQYALAQQAADGAATQLGPRHPQLIQLRSQVGAIRNDINAELRRIRASLQIEVERSQQQEKELAARLAQMKVQQASDNNELVHLRELEREAAARRDIYEATLLRSRETGEQEGLNTVNFRVLSAARPQLDPAGSARKLIVIAGLLAGFLVGLAIAAARNFKRLVRRPA